MRWAVQRTSFCAVHVRPAIRLLCACWNFLSIRAYLVVATFCLSVTGYGKVIVALGFDYHVRLLSFSVTWHSLIHPTCRVQNLWPHHVPAVAFVLTYILSAVLCLAVGVMLLYHLWSISSGVTSVEAHDHEEYQRKARARGEVNSHIHHSDGLIFTED